MFHTDGQTDKSKKSSDTESEKSEVFSTLSGHQGTPKPRFQKLNEGSHVHNLLPYKKGHRMQNFLKELGIHHNHIVEPQNADPTTMIDKLHIHHSRSETSLSEKYGKPQEVIGKGR
jgi:hypothetical protein